MTNSRFPARFQIFSGSMLKLIAIISMFIDHSALLLNSELAFLSAPLFPALGNKITLYFIMRRIGRLAFPLFCFLISEGFLHTRNRKNYLLRLLVFAFISEIPFNLLVSGHIFRPTKQNVFFTLFFGALLIYILEHTKSEWMRAIGMVAVLYATILLKPDYGSAGAVLILLIYLFRTRPALQVAAAFPLLSGKITALAAFVPINLYNGQRGFIRSRALKYGFYLFYPLHILVLVAIKLALRAM